jgi:hypothetical protein
LRAAGCIWVAAADTADEVYAFALARHERSFVELGPVAESQVRVEPAEGRHGVGRAGAALLRHPATVISCGRSRPMT